MGNKFGKSSVDSKFTKPTGLYPTCEWDDKTVKKLINKKKVAPRYPGREEPGPELDESLPYARADLVVIDHALITEDAMLTTVQPQRPLHLRNASLVPSRSSSPPLHRGTSDNSGRHQNSGGAVNRSMKANQQPAGHPPTSLHRKHSHGEMKHKVGQTVQDRRAPRSTSGDGWGHGLTELKHGQILYDETEGIDGFYSTGCGEYCRCMRAISHRDPCVMSRRFIMDE